MEEPPAGPGPFAVRLRALREGASLTQEDLAERAGLSANAIGALERGERRRPYPHTVRALADALALDDIGRTELAAAARPGAGLAVVPDSLAFRAVPQTRSLVEPPNRLIGRESELADVLARLRGGTRLLVITGPGGVGKTRLAMAAAARLGPDFPDGVAVAELAHVRDEKLVLPTAAAALGLPQLTSLDVAQQVAVFVGERRPLLLLDNLEHVLGAAPEIAELLARCPHLVVLATSRAPLRIGAEQELPLTPLTLPEGTGVAAVLASPAGQLFLDRGRAVAPDLTVTPESAAVMAEICRRLDGVPLALELAAAHARLLEPKTLLERLDQAVGSARSRDRPERHRTMQSTLDWSYALLTRQEQLLLRRLSVFAGGFTLSSAERVAGSGLDTFAALTGLVEQSLVVAPDGEGRYRFLEPIRQYAAAQASTTEIAESAAAHAAYFGALAMEARSGLRGADQGAWLTRLEREHANLRVAVGTTVERREGGDAAVLLGRTWLYWALRGHAGEGLLWLDRILDEEANERTSLSQEERAWAYLAQAGLRYATGDISGTSTSGATAVTAGRSAGGALLAEALVLVGSASAYQGRQDAGELLAEAAELSRRSGDEWIQVHVLLAQAQISLIAEDVEGSRASLLEADRLARHLSSPFTLATALNVQASLSLAVEDDLAALTQLTEAAELATAAGIAWTLVYTVPALAGLAAPEQPGLAVRLFAAGAALARTTGLAPAFPPDVARAEHGLAVARASLESAIFDQEWQAGSAVGLDQVAELARSIAVVSRPVPT